MLGTVFICTLQPARGDKVVVETIGVDTCQFNDVAEGDYTVTVAIDDGSSPTVD